MLIHAIVLLFFRDVWSSHVDMCRYLVNDIWLTAKEMGLVKDVYLP